MRSGHVFAIMNVMRIVDAHCHLESEELADRVQPVLEQARQAGIVKVITNAVEPGQWETSLILAREYPEVECAIGLHPWFVKPEHESQLDQLTHAKAQGAVAIGEIGLDAKIEVPMDLQCKLFEDQLDIAESLGLPAVIHCRGAFNEVLQSIKRVGPPSAGALMHAFSGSIEIAEQLLEYGFKFSMGRSLTYRNSKKRARILHRIYPDHFLLETDSPDMPPVEVEDEVNVPANIRYNLCAAAEILERPEEEVAETTTRNAVALFALNLQAAHG